MYFRAMCCFYYTMTVIQPTLHNYTFIHRAELSEQLIDTGSEYRLENSKSTRDYIEVREMFGVGVRIESRGEHPRVKRL